MPVSPGRPDLQRLANSPVLSHPPTPWGSTKHHGNKLNNESQLYCKNANKKTLNLKIYNIVNSQNKNALLPKFEPPDDEINKVGRLALAAGFNNCSWHGISCRLVTVRTPVLTADTFSIRGNQWSGLQGISCWLHRSGGSPSDKTLFKVPSGIIKANEANTIQPFPHFYKLSGFQC